MRDRKVVKANPPPMTRIFLSSKTFDRIPVSQGASNTDRRSCFDLMESRGDHTRLVDREFEGAFLCGGGGDSKGGFPFPEERQFAKLAGDEVERFLILLVHKAQLKGSEHPV